MAPEQGSEGTYQEGAGATVGAQFLNLQRALAQGFSFSLPIFQFGQLQQPQAQQGHSNSKRSKSRFIAGLRGNGLDTRRLKESLLGLVELGGVLGSAQHLLMPQVPAAHCHMRRDRVCSANPAAECMQGGN